jgi:hypothetical protein
MKKEKAMNFYQKAPCYSSDIVLLCFSKHMSLFSPSDHGTVNKLQSGHFIFSKVSLKACEKAIVAFVFQPFRGLAV